MAPADTIAQLQQQQSLLTQALRAMLEGNWCGAPPSVQAFVDALNPALHPTCVPPYRQSDEDAPPEPPPEHYFDPNAEQISQIYNWTCSACSLEWLLRAYDASYGSDIYSNRESCTYDIGYPSNINPTYGLMDGSGAQLRRVFEERTGASTAQGWLTFDQAWSIARAGNGGMCSGGAWYHWCGIRGTDGDTIWISNSAPGYQSVWNNLSRLDWSRLGPFSCVWVLP